MTHRKKEIIRVLAAVLICCVALSACGTAKKKGDSKDEGKTSQTTVQKEDESQGGDEVAATDVAALPPLGDAYNGITNITDLGNKSYVNIYGRHYYDSGMKAYAFPNSASGFEVKFRGTDLIAAMAMSAGSAQFSVFVDGAKDSNAIVVKVSSATFTNVQLVSKLSPGEHTVKVLKRTASNSGIACVRSICTNGVFLRVPSRRAVSIEFYGDSITCGSAVLRTKQWDPVTGKEINETSNNDTQNVFQSYAGVAAGLLDADFNVFGRGGANLYASAPVHSVVQSYNSISYDQDPAAYPYDWNSYRPNAVVIYLGTNDFNNAKFTYDDFEAEMEKFIREVIGAHYGNAIPIVLCSGQMVPQSDLNASMGRIVSALKGEFPNIDNVVFPAAESGHPIVAEAEEAGRLLAAKLRQMLR